MNIVSTIENLKAQNILLGAEDEKLGRTVQRKFELQEKLTDEKMNVEVILGASTDEDELAVATKRNAHLGMILPKIKGEVEKAEAGLIGNKAKRDSNNALIKRLGAFKHLQATDPKKALETLTKTYGAGLCMSLKDILAKRKQLRKKIGPPPPPAPYVKHVHDFNRINKAKAEAQGRAHVGKSEGPKLTAEQRNVNIWVDKILERASRVPNEELETATLLSFIHADELSSLTPKLANAISDEINRRANLNRQIRAIFAIA